MRLAGVCMRHLRRHAVGYLALFVALGGSSYAALSLPKNSVGTPQIRNKAVTLGKISKRTRRSLRGEQGPQGAQGAQGAQGGQGPAGAPGPTASAFGVATIASEFGLTTSDQTAVE